MRNTIKVCEGVVITNLPTLVCLRAGRPKREWNWEWLYNLHVCSIHSEGMLASQHPPDPAYSTPLTPRKMDTWNGITLLRLSEKNEQVTNRMSQRERMAQKAKAGWKHPDTLT
jgi:hypothetical protein